MSIEELPTIIPGNILAPIQGFRYPQSYPGARKKRSPPAIFWPPLRGSASFILYLLSIETVSLARPSYPDGPEPRPHKF
jgi:hypothetical protein